jgi:IclR family pca regulon transcriptional regulator
VIDAYFSRVVFQRFTEHTMTDERALRRVLADVRAKGYAAIQDELDYGIVSVSLPIFAPSGRLVAAANCSDVTNRLDRDTMIRDRLPVLRQAVRRIEGMLAQYPELTNSVTAVGADYLRLPAVARVRQPIGELRQGRRANGAARRTSAR